MTPPVFAHGHLRLYLLSLLQERPMHGYELIQALEERFGGTYSPSAGTIYPRLAKLEEEGLVSRSADGRKSVYELTDAGRAEVLARADELEQVEAGVTDSVRRLADDVRGSVESAMRTLRAELAVAASRARSDGAPAATARGIAVPVVPPDPAPPEAGAERAAAPDARIAGRRRLEEAELLLAGFRADLRASLHARFAATDAFGPDALAELRAALDEARTRIESALRPPPPAR